MALASIISGQDCGPINPLQSLTKTFHRDRTLQQDHFGPVAGPSQIFRSQRNRTLPENTDLNRFVSPERNTPSPFDLGALSYTLENRNHSPVPVPNWANDFARNDAALSNGRTDDHPTFNSHAIPQWANDFQNLQTESLPSAMSNSQTRIENSRFSASVPLEPHLYQHPALHLNQYASPSPLWQNSIPIENRLMPIKDEGIQVDAKAWETVFESKSRHIVGNSIHENQTDRIVDEQLINQITSESKHTENFQSDDELARTAGEIITNIAEERNPKFLNSQFLGLMRKLRDHEVAVEGNKVVEQLKPVIPTASSEAKGKGRAVENVPEILHPGNPWSSHQNFNRQFSERSHSTSLDVDEYANTVREGYEELANMWQEEDALRERNLNRMQFQGDGGLASMEMETEEVELPADTSVPGSSMNWEEDFDFDPRGIVGRSFSPPPIASTSTKLTPQQAEWNQLQDDWDNFEATQSGIRPVVDSVNTHGYTFQKQNPYLHHYRSREHLINQHPLTRDLDSILQSEAEVQSDASNPFAWLNLGIKQQENEREDLAILALRKALELDSSLAQAWLALAVSFTNENDRSKAYEALNRWIDCKDEYRIMIDEYRSAHTGVEFEESKHSSSLARKHEYLTDLLIKLVQSRTGNERIDADLQMALGVLFNTSEEYDKAGDCFAAALSVNPENSVLFNRLGATLANSGKAEEAIQYYFKALEINPAYARARYNLAIACINLNNYHEAAEHLLGALALQEEDTAQMNQSLGSGEAFPKAEFSGTLWDTLKMCCSLLNRPDLANVCESRDLEDFRSEFNF